MRLHHRVAVKPSQVHGWWRWHWSCPGCSLVGLGEPARLDAIRAGRIHATSCDHLRILNRQAAWACRNCDGSGLAGLSCCPVCLGRGWAV